MKISLGIIGTGRIASRAVEEIRATDCFEIEAVVNPHAGHAKEFAEKNRIKNFFSEIEELSEKVDAVYVASPHGTHYDYAMNLLQMGIHVICEKPAVLNGKQAEEIFKFADEKGLVFMEGIKTAFCPGFKQIEDVVSSGRIGDIVDVEAVFTRLTQAGCREYEDKMYGGAFSEFGTYTLLPILRFLGTEGFSVSFALRQVEGVDGYTKVFFDYGDRFACAKTGIAAKSEGQLVIAGTKGYILVPSPWWLTRYFEVRYEDPAKIERFECEFKGDGLRYEFCEFARRINEGMGNQDRERREMKARAGVFGDFLKQRKTK